MAAFEPVLMRNVGVENSTSLDVYRSRGGYETLRNALQMPPDDIIKAVSEANLRGRGGAGFPTGMKWGFLPKDRTETYMCVNADEAEPPTFCNRVLMEHDPHQLIEGIAISCFAIQAQTAYIYLRVEFHEPFYILERALEDAYEANLLGENILGSGFNLNIYCHRGAGAYICGEETGLIESIEGKRGWPRIKPPFPAVEGVFRKPTIVNNVETLACVTHIVERGAEWFKNIGTEKSTGPKMYCVSGHVNKPGCYEYPLGVNLRTLIDEAAGGIPEGRAIKAVAPGGISMGFLRGDEIDVPMDFESFNVKTNGLLGLGTGAVVVMDERTSMLDVLHNTARFFATESCGQCTHCREGTGWIWKVTQRMCDGRGKAEDLDFIAEISNKMGMMPGMNICGLSDGAAFPLRTLVTKFRNELIDEMNTRAGGAVAAQPATA